MGEIPPLVNGLCAGELIYNTEMNKSNKLTRLRGVQLLGSQKVLLDLLNAKLLDPSNLPQSLSELKDLCAKLEMNVTG